MRPLDHHFAALLTRLSGAAASPELTLAATLVSRELGEGHVCLDLRRFAGRTWGDGEADTQCPTFEAWRRTLLASPVVGKPGDRQPLILDAAGRLYLHRYWNYEDQLARAIVRLVKAPGLVEPSLARHKRGKDGFHPVPSLAPAATPAPFARGPELDRYFPAHEQASEPDWQRVAAEAALTRRFCVISGGPGTGKTRTLAVVLALLLEHAGPRPPRVAVAAPTGKAAARIQEALRRAREELPCSAAVKKLLPTEARTLHRLLGPIPDSSRFRHDAENPLPFDFIAVDEASMVDLALMAKLFSALPAQARVVLLGDKDQLASVEAGAVLADICAGLTERAGISACGAAGEGAVQGQGFSNQVEAPPVIELRKNYRFSAESAVGRLSAAIRDGDADATRQILSGNRGGAAGVATQSLPAAAELKAALRKPLLTGFRAFLRAEEPAAALEALERFRVLCALREGPFGVRRVNELAAAIFEEEELLQPRGKWYPHRPVMVTRNDYDLHLFNGDTGALLPHPKSGELRAWFRDAEGELRDFAPARLPEHETCFALTVHKSQGSEFDRVLLLLPDRESLVLTRELLYTGLTRARSSVELWLNEPVFLAAIGRRVERSSGLREALAGYCRSASSAPMKSEGVVTRQNRHPHHL